MALNLPSVSKITQLASESVQRFPLVLLCGIAATFCSMILFELTDTGTDLYMYLSSATAVLFLGISFFFAIDVYAERSEISISNHRIYRVIGAILLIAYFFVLGKQFSIGPARIWFQFTLLALSSHLLVAFAPFIHRGSVDEFWEFNKSLFLRFLMSAFFAGVLYIGMVIALVAIENLLEFDLSDDIFFHLFVFMSGVFITWFFLAGVPLLKNGVSIQPYYKVLKIFVQYVLIPLVTVYIVILYLYLGKIILQWELPNGWVSYLVLSFSIAGILSLLLLYPIQHKEGNTWIKVYSKGYYLALIPLIGLLMVSIYTRISEYGVTINRFLVTTLGVWLTGVVLYFIISKTKNIKVIPSSLGVIALLISFGPLGASAVSERSQLGRFEAILSSNGMVEGSVIGPVTNEVSFEDQKELSSIVNYINEFHGMDAFSSLLGRDIESILDDSVLISNLDIEVTPNSSDVRKFMAYLNVEYVNDWGIESTEEVRQYFDYSVSDRALISISGYEQLFSTTFYNYDGEEVLREFDGYSLTYNSNDVKLLLRSTASESELEFELQEFIDELAGDEVQSILTMTISEENEFFDARLIINRINGYFADEIEIQTLNLTVMVNE